MFENDRNNCYCAGRERIRASESENEYHKGKPAGKRHAKYGTGEKRRAKEREGEGDSKKRAVGKKKHRTGPGTVAQVK